MTSIEKKMLIAIGALLLVFVGSCTVLVSSLESEFGHCAGLKGAVNKVWTGEDCVSLGQSDD